MTPTTAAPPNTIALSLVSHTNVGKTTLARTLLGRDVGEVRDAPHVTEFADMHTLITSAAGDTLQLWDTPGFGDSVRLLARLRATANPLGWFMGAVWDRWRDRPFWASQQALRNVRDHADVVLYLVSAAEAPEAAGYVTPEMALLAWTGKPVIVLLNQMGAPRAADIEAAELDRWNKHLAPHRQVAAVLPLDAFARCWVQELTLLATVERALPAATQARMARLRAAWQAQREATFHAAMDVLAHSLVRMAAARQVVPTGDGLGATWRALGGSMASSVRRRIGKRAGDWLGHDQAHADQRPVALAQAALAAQLDVALRQDTAQLIALHGLKGDAHSEILARLDAHFAVRLRVAEGNAALWGGVLTGALVGLKADIASGGLTLGGGALAGGLLGALGAAGLARGVNLVRGTQDSWLNWNAEALDHACDAALLRYLAVAHFGRGRGDWAQSEAPAHWQAVVTDALAPQRAALAALWASRSKNGAAAADATLMVLALRPLITQATRAALDSLYPGRWTADTPPDKTV